MSDRIMIDKGIPMPPPKQRRGMYPFSQMDVGDSFVLSGSMNSAHAAAHYGKKANPGKLFRARQMANGEVRIWRVQ